MPASDVQRSSRSTTKPQACARVNSLGDSALPVTIELATDCAARLRLGQHSRSRQFPIDIVV